MASNKLEPIFSTGVKFYSSITRRQALGQDSIGMDKNNNPIYVEPGAVCFVADDKGNSIFLNRLLFGDGATAGSISGGGGTGGGTGLTEVTLSDVVVIEKDGEVLKTLSDYFSSNGDVVSESFKVKTTNESGQVVEVITIDKTGIKIGGNSVATVADITANNESLLNSAQNKADAALNAAKAYSDQLLTSVYKVKGSKESYSDLEAITNPENGDVWNVKSSYGTTPAGTNWVYIKNEDGTGYWDALGGSINLSLDEYAKKSDMNTAIGTAKSELEGKIGQAKSEIINENITPLSNSLNDTSAKLTTAIGNINTLTTNVTTNTTNITNIATQLTWQ